MSDRSNKFLSSFRDDMGGFTVSPELYGEIKRKTILEDMLSFPSYILSKMESGIWREKSYEIGIHFPFYPVRKVLWIISEKLGLGDNY